MNIIPATAELFGEYYGDLPFNVPTMRAYFLAIDDKPVGICGFVRRSKYEMVVFTEAKDGVLENNKLSVMKFAKAMLKIADLNKWTLIANRDEDIPTSAFFLAYLGFEQDEDGEYIRWQA
jgi:hypothetical protein